MAGNPFDQFDAAPSQGGAPPQSAPAAPSGNLSQAQNPFDQFDSVSLGGTAAPSGAAQSSVDTSAQPSDWTDRLASLAGQYLGSPAQQLVRQTGIGLRGAAEAAQHLVSLPADAAHAAYDLATDPGARAATLAQLQHPSTWFTEPSDAPSATVSRDLGAVLPTPQGIPEQLLSGTTGLLTGAALPIPGLPAPEAAVTSASNPAVSTAAQLGVRLTPAQAGAGPIPRTLAAFASRPQLERELSAHNANIVNTAALKEIGMPPDAPLSERTFDAARAPANAVYQQVASLGPVTTDDAYLNDLAQAESAGSDASFSGKPTQAITDLVSRFTVPQFDAADAVQQVRQLRRDASAAFNGPYDPASQTLRQAQRQVANALENQMDRHVQSLAASGAQTPPDLIAQLRAARQQLAKVANVEDAVVGGTDEGGGYVSAQKLLQQMNRGAPLSGNLKSVAQLADNFDRSLQAPNKIREHPVGFGDLALGALGEQGLGMTGFALAASRPAIRAALASRLAQRYLTGPSGPSVNTGALSQGLMASPTTLPGATNAVPPNLQGLADKYGIGAPTQ